MPTEELLKLDPEGRAALARARLGRILTQALMVTDGLLEVPPKGSAHVLLVDTNPDGSWRGGLGKKTLSEIGKLSRFPAAEIEAQLGSYGGQAVLAVYLEGEFVFSEILEIRAERLSTRPKQ